MCDRTHTFTVGGRRVVGAIWNADAGDLSSRPEWTANSGNPLKGRERKAWLIRIACLDTTYCLSIFISTCSKSASQLGRLV